VNTDGTNKQKPGSDFIVRLGDAGIATGLCIKRYLAVTAENTIWYSGAELEQQRTRISRPRIWRKVSYVLNELLVIRSQVHRLMQEMKKKRLHALQRSLDAGKGTARTECSFKHIREAAKTKISAVKLTASRNAIDAVEAAVVAYDDED